MGHFYTCSNIICINKHISKNLRVYGTIVLKKQLGQKIKFFSPVDRSSGFEQPKKHKQTEECLLSTFPPTAGPALPRESVS
ncbi:hypothetical protein Q5P01_023156 [Channa striata]|uniref:Uncharacterized protein n=1 Tax=Channa striata TaxID=64152 RepID=A0AA88IVW0_CHASR|nr:hypothetical protein Q5P01_023156 [Channa striata]